MPTERDVDEKHYFWCPKWYWPFAVCSRTRRVHKWCYNFSWVRETGYGLASHLEGCENGKLYTWTEFSFGVFGSTTYAGGEMCFDSPRGSDGRCDSSNTGLQASGLSPSAPFVSNVDTSQSEIRAAEVESGAFQFTPEIGALCHQEGLWPWRRTLHYQVMTASVATRFVSVQWYVGGTPVAGASGQVTLSALCRWPFPLPKGRSEHRAVHLTYEIVTEANKSTLRVFNDPADGSYSFGVSMAASGDGREYTADNLAYFTGETCDFNAAQLKERADCLHRLNEFIKAKTKSRRPIPGEPNVVFAEELWRLIPQERHDLAAAMLEILANTFHDDPETYAKVLDQLEEELGFAGLARLISSGSPRGGQRVVLQRQ